MPASLGDCLFSGNNRLWVIRKCRPNRILNLWDSEVTSVGIQSALINLSPLEVILHDSFVATFGSSSSDGRNRRQHRVFVWFPCFAKEFPHWRKKPFWVGILVSVSEKRKKQLQTVSLMKILLDLLLDWKITNLTIDGTRTIVFIFSQSVDPILRVIRLEVCAGDKGSKSAPLKIRSNQKIYLNNKQFQSNSNSI